MEPLIDVGRLVLLQTDAVDRWHDGTTGQEPKETLWELISLLQEHNTNLWHEEDKARDPEAGPPVIAQVKRNIDKFNQARVDTIEQIDDLLLELLTARNIQPGEGTALHSETVGSIIDRLSILALRIFHMREQTGRRDVDEAHREKCAARLAVLEEQHQDLARCLEELLEDLGAGRKRFKVYRQMKMYNDPTLNPVLYGGSE